MKRYILAVTLFAATLSVTAVQAQSCPAIDVSPSVFPDATLNIAYTQGLSATGGASPYAYGVSSGSIPPGLRIISDRLKGTPTSAGTYSFTIIAIDVNACLGNRAYTMKVINPANSCQPVTLSPSVIPSAVTGRLYGTKFTAFSATSTSFTFAFQGTLPPGLGFLNQTLTGTPNKPGVYEFDIVATDTAPAHCAGTQHYELTVVPAGCPEDVVSVFSPPSNANFDASQSILFAWTAVPGATRYEVLVSSDNGATFKTAATTPNGSTTSSAITLGPGKYLGVVRTIFSTNCDTRSALARFTVGGTACGTTPPTPMAPKNNDVSSDTSVTFAWTTVPNATSYEVFTSLNDGPFTDIGGTGGTSLTRLLQPGTIDWYVEARFATCAAVRSATTRFTVAPAQCGSGAISPQSPANGATVSSPVTFSWTGISGASAYRIWAGVDGKAAINVARVTTTTATVPLMSGAIDWYVEALFANCPSVVSPHAQFTVPRAAACGTAAPVLVSPIDTDVTSPVTFHWNAASGAVAYHLWIAATGDAFAGAGLTAGTQLTQALASGSYSWYVDAIAAGCPPVSSPAANFRIPETANCSGQAPVILTPANNASQTSPVTFTWTPASGATEYRVFASVDGGAVKLVGRNDDPTLTTAMPPGTISWFVEAAFDGCPGTHSQPSRFTVPQATNCPQVKPVLLSPANGASGTVSPVTFNWTPVAGAVRYIVIVRAARGAAAAIGDTTATQIQRDVPVGDLEWWVIALGSGCNGVVSDHNKFKVPDPAGCDSRRPHPLAPADDASDVASPVHFAWTKSANAKSYRLFAAINGDEPALVATTTSNEISVPMPAGNVRWSVEAVFDSCPALFSALNHVRVAGASTTCQAPSRPVAYVVAQVLSGTDYNVRWTGVPNASVYELQEATAGSFANAATTTVTAVSAHFTRTASTAPVPYFYRVRAVSACSDDRSGWSRVAATRVIPPDTVATRERATADLATENPVVQTIAIGPESAGAQFSATTNRPWMTVTPPGGTVPATGQTLTVTSQPSQIGPGSNQGAVHLTLSGGSSGRLETQSNKPATVPISVSLVTPVAPDTTATPLPTSLIIPAIAHGPGANNSLFESDIRVANVSSQAMKYLINFTPTATDGTQTGTTTTIQIDPGASTALNDILSTFFGTPASGGASGMLEIRPLTDSSSSPSLFSVVPDNLFTTVASSRTYNITSAGTFGQFIPAIPFSQFAGKGSTLSLQQIAESAAYRTNFGLVEASGAPASVMLHVFDKSGTLLADIPESLLPSEHLQLNGLLSANGIALDDGRIEVEVLSDTGKVSAYASVVDNRTNDPLLVSPVLKGSVNASRYVIPGVAYTNTIANWRTDARLYNSAATSVTATLTYYPQTGSSDMTPVVRTAAIAAGETKDLDNILNTTFGVTETNAGGSVLITTTDTSSIIASARTYALVDNGGTIGQFVPAVTVADSVGAGERSLQLLQLESSDGFRTNIGLVETSGNSATAEVSLVLPDSKLTPVISVPLAANEFLQFPLSSFGIANPLYNARVSVRVVDGSGRVSAYGSLIDNVSQDPAYVPAQ